MEAWPVEEAYVVRPLGSLAVAALLPFVTGALSRAVLGDERATRLHTMVPVRAAQLAVAWLLGMTALGPLLASSRISVASHAAAVACVAVALAGDRAQWKDGDERWLLGGLALAVALSAAMAYLFDGYALAGAAVLFSAGYAAFPNGLVTNGGVTRVIGWVVAGLLFTLIALPWTLTSIDRSEVSRVDDATWRLRIDPWDENAMLAAGWASRRRGELDRANAQAREAVRMGLPMGPALELEAEVLAARGDCDAARETFDRALRARAEEAFGGDAELATPLVLGGYQLPPTLVTRCDGLEQLPGFDDLTLE